MRCVEQITDADIASIPALFELYGEETSFPRYAVAGDGSAIARIHRQGAFDSYVHPQGAHGATESSVRSYVEESLRVRKPGEYWEECIAGRGQDDYHQIIVVESTLAENGIIAFATTDMHEDPRLLELGSIYTDRRHRREHAGAKLAYHALFEAQRSNRTLYAITTKWSMSDLFYGFCGAYVVGEDVQTEKIQPLLERDIMLLQSSVMIPSRLDLKRGAGYCNERLELLRELYPAR